MRSFVTAVRADKTGKLAQCTKGSLSEGVMLAAQLGLSLAPAMGQGRGVVIAEVLTDAGLARVRLGAGFLIDYELQAAVQRMQAAARDAPVRLSVVAG